MPILLIGLYIACELVANVTASKPIQIGGLVVPAAIFIYTLTFTLIDLINESMGKQGARRVILAAFAANLLLAAYAQLTVLLPPATFYTGQEAYASVLGTTPRIVFASLTAYLVSSLIDAELFAFWKTRLRGPRWLRVLVSNAISTGVDSVLFICLAFYGLMPIWPLIQGQYVVKMAITLVSLPLIYLVKGPGRFRLKTVEVYRQSL
ncbi:MAG: queuosine precursor transporter [Desulfobacterota bacterium]|nr:queuosine precursor transporter [Thermodesulfobacteriota bacterium]